MSPVSSLRAAVEDAARQLAIAMQACSAAAEPVGLDRRGGGPLADSSIGVVRRELIKGILRERDTVLRERIAAPAADAGALQVWHPLTADWRDGVFAAESGAPVPGVTGRALTAPSVMAAISALLHPYVPALASDRDLEWGDARLSAVAADGELTGGARGEWLDQLLHPESAEMREQLQACRQSPTDAGGPDARHSGPRH